MAAAFLAKYSQVLAAGGLACVIGASLAPQTLGLSRYRGVLASYQHGEEQPVHPHVTSLVEKVLIRARLTAEDEAGLQFFTCFGNDPVSKGSAYLHTGAIIGVPPTFSYASHTDIDRSRLIAGGRHIDWDSPAAERLSNAMVLSDRARAFGIAREVMQCSSYHVMIDGGLRCTFIGLAYMTGFMMNHRLQLKHRMKIWGRMGIYGVIGGLAYVMYTVLADTYYCWLDGSADRRAARLGWAYADGGVDFYEKALERNKALRELLGEDGKKVYTVYGNEASTIRRAALELTERKKALEKFLKEYEDKEENEVKS